MLNVKAIFLSVIVFIITFCLSIIFLFKITGKMDIFIGFFINRYNAKESYQTIPSNGLNEIISNSITESRKNNINKKDISNTPASSSSASANENKDEGIKILLEKMNEPEKAVQAAQLTQPQDSQTNTSSTSPKTDKQKNDEQKRQTADELYWALQQLP